MCHLWRMHALRIRNFKNSLQSCMFFPHSSKLCSKLVCVSVVSNSDRIIYYLICVSCMGKFIAMRFSCVWTSAGVVCLTHIDFSFQFSYYYHKICSFSITVSWSINPPSPSSFRLDAMALLNEHINSPNKHTYFIFEYKTVMLYMLCLFVSLHY